MNIIQAMLVQMGYYAAVMALTLLLLGMLQKGFFFPFLRVRASFGRLVLVKVKAINRDYFRVGRVDEGFLVYKHEGQDKRINIADSSSIYRSIGGTNWIDVDEESNSILLPDLSGVNGFDAVKFQNLLTRALTRPSITDNKDKALLGAVLLLCVLVVILGFLIYKQGATIEGLPGMIQSVKQSMSQGIVVPGG